jgi:hypothetical protein
MLYLFAMKFPSILANSTPIRFFSEMLKFSKRIILWNQKIIVKDNSEYLRIFHLLKWIFKINYLTNMCWNGQGTMVSFLQGGENR